MLLNQISLRKVKREYFILSKFKMAIKTIVIIIIVCMVVDKYAKTLAIKKKKNQLLFFFFLRKHRFMYLLNHFIIIRI